jgi:hypothetical protein
MTTRGLKRTGDAADRWCVLTCGDFKALTSTEQQALGIAAGLDGTATIPRRLLLKVLEERDRLIFVLDAARWLAEEADTEFCRNPPDLIKPTKVEKATGALRQALRALDADLYLQSEKPPKRGTSSQNKSKRAET